jgi:hypothetical protein
VARLNAVEEEDEEEEERLITTTDALELIGGGEAPLVIPSVRLQCDCRGAIN